MKSRLTAFLFCSAVLITNMPAQVGEEKPVQPGRRMVAAAVAQLAATLAATLANNESRKQFGTEPFTPQSAPAVLVGNRWEWQGSAGYGKGDLRAKVSFLENGSEPKVELQTLVNDADAAVRKR